tara:strand:+ start:779 stop:2464 length:1686 start_codon:yes stop_codon:yes gene_type:complete
MASSGNFPLWSPLIKDAVNLSKGNTRFDGTTSSRGAMTSFAIPTGTKFYVELLVKQFNYYNIVFGLANPQFNVGTYDESDASINGIIFRANTASSWDTCSLTNGSRGSFGSNVGQTSARVLAMTVNRVDNEIKMYLDNTLKHTISISATEVYHIVCSFTGGANSNVHMNINCGHDSTGAGDFSAGGNADENGFGDFQYSPPTGFLAPSSANLPISDDIDPAQTDDDYPSKQFGVVTYTGNTSTNAITGLGFQPDLVWVKSRNQSRNSYMADSSRGTNKIISSTLTEVERTETNLTSFDTDGFTLSNNYDYRQNWNESGYTYVGWCWRANGGTTASNSDGSITSTVQANTKAGFSIITYTGTGSNATIGHGLSKAPEFYIVKNRSSGENWTCYHVGIGETHYLTLNTDAVASDNNTFWNDTAPTTSVISLGTNARCNGSSNNMVGYAWHSVDGMQRFGKYTGNGNSNGAFIYTGFRPSLIFLKNTESASSWLVHDDERDTFNPVNEILLWNTSDAEFESGDRVDFLSNGFKLRNSNAGMNGSGTQYVYGAWASTPFKYNNTF